MSITTEDAKDMIRDVLTEAQAGLNDRDIKSLIGEWKSSGLISDKQGSNKEESTK